MEKIIINTDTNIFQTKPNKVIGDINSFLGYYQNYIDKNVVGWFFPLDIVLAYAIIREAQNFSGNICELGVAFGKSAVGLSLLKNQDEKLYLFDNFAAEISLQDTQNRLKEYGKDENVIWNTSDLMKLQYTDISDITNLRYLHIDACHLHNAVLNDLRNFSPKLLDKGVIVVDDYNDQEYPGINSAITEFCLENKAWSMFAIGQNKAYLCKNEFHNYYSKFVVEYIGKNISNLNMTLTEFIDHDVVLLGSRSPMTKERILDILNGEIELAYT